MESTERMINLIRDSGNFPDHIIHLSAPRVHNLQFHKLNWETYQKEIDISLRSIIMILQQFIPYMSKKKYGKIIFMLSAYLVGMPPSFLSSYITVKYALLGLMRNLAVEYASKRISVNAVSPDMMETKFLVDIPELVKEQSASNSPLGRNLFVEEVIPTLLYLLSDACDVVTGQNIHIGMSFKK
jgi:3-oxoacyl-[acyl-carrier protein] reductase